MTFINFFEEYWIFISLSFFLFLVLSWLLRKVYLLWRISYHQVSSLQKPEIRKNHFIMADHVQIDAIYEIDPINDKLIIFVNDFYNSKDDYVQYIKYFKKQKFNYVTFNFRYSHNLINKKNLSLGMLVSDLKTIVMLVKEKYPQQKIYLLGHGLGANIIMCSFSKEPSIQGIITLNMLNKTNFIDLDLKTRLVSFYGFWFDKNVVLPVVLLEELISSNLQYQLKLKAYFENKPLRWWYRLQVNPLIRKAVRNTNTNNTKLLLIHSKKHIFSKKRSLKRWQRTQTIKFIDEHHDLLWSNNYENYCQIISEWIVNHSKNIKEKN